MIFPRAHALTFGTYTLGFDAAGTLLVNGSPIGGGSGGGTMAAQDANAVAITGGAIDNTPIGATTPATIRATTLAATAGTVTADGGAAAPPSLLLSSRGTQAATDPNICLLTSSPAPGVGLGQAGTTGWAFVARVHGDTSGQADQLLWSFFDGATWNEHFRLLPNGPLQVGSLYATALFVGGVNALDGAPIGATTPAAGRFSTLFTTGADIEGGTIDATAIGNTTPSTGRFTTLAVTGSLTAKFVLAAPNAAAGAPTWRQLLASDVSGLGVLATADPAAPPALGATTANTGRFSTLTHTGFLLRSMATGLTASATNTQAGALGLTASVNIITTAAANTAVRLPSAAPATGTAAEIIIRNNGANPVNCFPPTNGVINSLAANAAISIPAGTGMRFLQTSATQYYVA